jgi:hypothetical protein
LIWIDSKLNEVEVREHYEVNMSGRFAALALDGMWGHKEGLGKYKTEYKNFS